MSSHIELRQINDVPAGARVADYDELGPETRTHLDALLSSETHGVPNAAQNSFEDYDVIRFTDYYEVRVGSVAHQ